MQHFIFLSNILFFCYAFISSSVSIENVVEMAPVDGAGIYKPNYEKGAKILRYLQEGAANPPEGVPSTTTLPQTTLSQTTLPTSGLPIEFTQIQQMVDATCTSLLKEKCKHPVQSLVIMMNLGVSLLNVTLKDMLDCFIRSADKCVDATEASESKCALCSANDPAALCVVSEASVNLCGMAENVFNQYMENMFPSTESKAYNFKDAAQCMINFDNEDQCKSNAHNCTFCGLNPQYGWPADSGLCLQTDIVNYDSNFSLCKQLDDFTGAPVVNETPNDDKVSDTGDSPNASFHIYGLISTVTFALISTLF